LSNVANYFHTLRFLRPVQVYGRIRFRLWRPSPDERPAPAPRIPANPYSTPIGAQVSMLGPDRFRFLNLEGSCSTAAHWAGDGRSHLWKYNLHYFEDLVAGDASSRHSWHQEILDRWVDENPPGVGVGWDSYPLSRRVVNWIKWALGGTLPTPKIRQSLAVQVRWLTRRIESHLQGNHLFANAKALVHAGLYFDGEEAENWFRRGLSLMRTQIGEQVLIDGGHFERSTMYHAGFVEDLLDTVGILRAFGRTVDPTWPATVARMMSWLEAMSHPDGEIAFFNDAAFGIFPTPGALRAYAERLNVPLNTFGRAGLRILMPSGYVSIDSPPVFLVCDVAPIGPDHLPGHAHADTLSFEMSFRGRRIFVNSGTSEYGLSSERQRQRGTAAHNTLVLDGKDSSEVWAGFRVARRAQGRLLGATAEDPGFIVIGEHDGYRRLRRGNVHRRRWTLGARELLIEDTVEGRFDGAMCYYHLHPGIQVTPVAEFHLQLSDSGGFLFEVRFEGAAGVDVVDSTWHPEFGVALANRSIVAQLDGQRLVASIRWSE
jgi:uncharacterized heparinase superfamily protein